MKIIKDVFEVKQKKVQMKGMTYSQVLWTNFHGNEVAMKDSIARGCRKEKKTSFICKGICTSTLWEAEKLCSLDLEGPMS